MTYDTWKTTNPDDENRDGELPCDWEKFSGVCLVCGAGIDDECEIERERRRARRAS